MLQGLGERLPVALNGLEVIHNGNAEAGCGVEHCQHNDVQCQISKERLQAPHSSVVPVPEHCNKYPLGDVPVSG